MDIQDVIRQHRTKWIEAKQWKDPNLADCLDFMATEVAEAIDSACDCLTPMSEILMN